MTSADKCRQSALLLLLMTLTGCVSPSGNQSPSVATAAGPPPACARALVPGPRPQRTRLCRKSPIRSLAKRRPCSRHPRGSVQRSDRALGGAAGGRGASPQPVAAGDGAAWQAAAQRYPQMISLEDPMFGFMIGPAGVGTMDGGGWMVMGSQKIPWPGKRQLRGQAAQAEADMAYARRRRRQLMLAEAAKMAFYDYYLAHRQLEVNAGFRGPGPRLPRDRPGQVRVQQGLAAGPADGRPGIGELQSRGTELARDGAGGDGADQYAVAPRGRSSAAASARQAVGLPERCRRPTSCSNGRRSSGPICPRLRPDPCRAGQPGRWPGRTIIPTWKWWPSTTASCPTTCDAQVGMNFNVPLSLRSRSAAVREAHSESPNAAAEYQDRLDEVRYEVQSARARVSQRRVRAAVRGKILPATQRNLESAQANYTSGKLDFLRLIDAERQLDSQRKCTTSRLPNTIAGWRSWNGPWAGRSHRNPSCPTRSGCRVGCHVHACVGM